MKVYLDQDIIETHCAIGETSIIREHDVHVKV